MDTIQGNGNVSWRSSLHGEWSTEFPHCSRNLDLIRGSGD